MSPSDAAWVERIDLAFVERRLGHAQVERFLREARPYAETPRLDGSGRLVAAFEGEDPPLVVKLRVDFSTGALEVGCACTRGRPITCEHVMRALVDLAVHPGLRAAISAGEPARERVAELAALKGEIYSERSLDEGLARWLPPSGARTELEIDVEVVRYTGVPSPEARPAVLLRHRSPPSLKVMKPKEVVEANLSASRRRLVDLTSPGHLHRDALVSTRAPAALLIHFLRDELHAKTGGFKRPLRFSKEAVAPRVEREGNTLVVRWCTTAGRIVCNAADALLFAGPFSYLWSEAHEAFHPVSPDVDLDVAWGFHAVPSLVVTERSAARVGRLLLGRGRAPGVTLPPPEAFGLPRLQGPSFVLCLAGLPLEVRAQLRAAYPRGTVTLGTEDGTSVEGRDVDAEARAVGLAKQAGLKEEEDGALRAGGESAVLFWQQGIALLRESKDPPIEVRMDESLARVRIGQPAEVRVDVGAASGWLDTQLHFTVGALAVEMRAIRDAVASRQRWVALTDGTLTRITDAIADLVGETARLLDEGGRGRLAPHHLGRVAGWVERFGGSMDERATRLRTRLHALAVSPQPAVPAGLRATLRPYQMEGLAWLQFLRDLGAGGILADDMGLGKTVMTLALLAGWKEDEGPQPSIVVCPTSVVGNWMREAARFTPDLRVLLLDRTARDLEAVGGYDLIVTSYGLVRRDIERLASKRFRAAVLDEAQNVKNPDSMTSRAVGRLDAGLRLALSGTPVENRLGELWSLMNFANKGLLGDASDFDERFERAIAARPDGAVAEHLRAVVRPFVLRRTKAEVLTDLPPKTEVQRGCVFGVRQRRLYDALALTLRQAVKKNIEKRGLARSQLSVLTAILRLRQMACDPRLVDPTVPAADSAKRDAFLDLVRELVSEQRRALVFSQFVELLTLWREDLDRERIAYEYLDGSSANRGAIVDRFQQGAAPLFLISLKAGGAGLNLTAADTVIHCDPWWNPAVEDQATDRAHRIGQRRPVTVVRLVAAGTIEDKIGLLKAKKRKLAASVIGGAGALRGLDEADVSALLGDVDGATDRDAERDDAQDPPVAPAVPGFLRAVEVDELRGIVRWLEQTGMTRRDLGRRVGLAPSRMGLLLIGHRVPISATVADRIRALGVERGRRPG
jgi:superfamily II DNA or RNA helicase